MCRINWYDCHSRKEMMLGSMEIKGWLYHLEEIIYISRRVSHASVLERCKVRMHRINSISVLFWNSYTLWRSDATMWWIMVLHWKKVWFLVKIYLNTNDISDHAAYCYYFSSYITFWEKSIVVIYCLAAIWVVWLLFCFVCRLLESLLVSVSFYW